MSSKLDICNIAVSILGKTQIVSLQDNTNIARVLALLYDPTRKSLLEGRSTWRFSIKRSSIAQRADAPASGPYTTWFDLPGDCLKVLLAGDTYPGLDLSDYRLGPNDAGYLVESRQILCDYGSPLSLQYVYDVTDTGCFNPWFDMALAARIAWLGCERITGSSTKKKDAMAEYQTSISEARNSNALMNTPNAQADDSWIAARMQ